MRIAHLTDLHVGAQAGDQSAAERLRKVIADVNKSGADAVILTGDLADNGAPAEYATLRAHLKELRAPWYATIGNHDDRAAYRRAFPDAATADGFISFAVDFSGLRVVFADSQKDGSHNGDMCERRLAWLDERLSEAPKTPTLLALHHPPIPVGIGWMEDRSGSEWTERLREVVQRHPQVAILACGHIHRSMTRRFGGAQVVVAPATSVQLSLNLDDIDLAVPDGRPLVTAAPPGYVIYHLDRGDITTHVVTVEDYTIIAHYMKPFIAV